MNYSKEIYDIAKHPEWLIGGEVGEITKGDKPYTVSLLVPKLYPQAMQDDIFISLYSKLNMNSEVSVKRVFKLEKEVDEFLVNNKYELCTIGDHKSLKHSNVIILIISDGIEYTTCIRMLLLAGINPYRNSRGENEPIIVACMASIYNHKPIEPFVDVFVHANACDSVCKIVEQYCNFKKNITDNAKEAFLDSIIDMKNVYVSGSNVVKTIYTSRCDLDIVTSRIIPHIKNDECKITIKPMLCLNNNNREFKKQLQNEKTGILQVNSITDKVNELVKRTGINNIYIDASGTNNYDLLNKLIYDIENLKSNVKRNIFISNIKFTSKNIWCAKYINESEASIFIGTLRNNLQNKISMCDEKDDVMQTASKLYDFGFEKIHLQFYIGVPNETYEDLIKTVELAKKVCEMHNEKFCKLTYGYVVKVTYIPFIAYPFTLEEKLEINNLNRLEIKLRYINNLVNTEKIKIECDGLKQHEIRAILTRATSDISEAILFVAKKAKEFDYDTWVIAMKKCEYDAKTALKAIVGQVNWNNITVKEEEENI